MCVIHAAMEQPGWCEHSGIAAAVTAERDVTQCRMQL
jgi:hypothetical protein